MTSGKRLQSLIAPYAAVMAGISHPVRLGIAYNLSKHDMDVWEIIQTAKISPALVSHHLQLMYRTGWVKKTRVGKRVTYSLSPKNLKELHRLFADSPWWKEAFKSFT